MRRTMLLVSLVLVLTANGGAAQSRRPRPVFDSEMPATTASHDTLSSSTQQGSDIEAPSSVHPDAEGVFTSQGVKAAEPFLFLSSDRRIQGMDLAEAWAERAGVSGYPKSEKAQTNALGLLGGNFPIASVPDAVSALEDQGHPDAAHNPSRDEYLLVWDAYVRATSTNIYGRRLSSTGTPLGSVFVISGDSGGQVVPSVAHDASTGQYWVVWTDYRAGGNPNVYARRVSATGSPVGSEIQVNTGDAKAFAARVACGGGRCAIVWASDPGDGNSHILARGYDSSGSATTGIVRLSSLEGVATEPDICYNADDAHYLAVWYQWHVTNGWDVMGYRLTRELFGLGQMSISSASGHQRVPRVSYSPAADRYCVVWQDGRSMQTWDIYGQLVSRGGSLLGNALPIFAGSLYDGKPAVAGHPGASQFMVAFESDVTGAAQIQIYACTVSAGGAVSNAFVVRQWHEWRESPAIAAGSNQYLVAWRDFWTWDRPDIQAQRVGTNRTLQGALLRISIARKGQEAPSVAYGSGRSEYLAVWQDFRSGLDYDVYGRRVSATGEPVGGELIIATGGELINYPAVAYNHGSDEYLVVWSGIYSYDTGRDVYARRVRGDGQLMGAGFWVSRHTGAGNEGFPAVAYNESANEYLVVWHAWTNGWRVWGQRISAAGQLLGNNFRIVDSAGLGEWPRTAYNPQRNEYVVVWFDQRNEGRWGVYGQRLSSTGTLLGGNFAVSTALFDVKGIGKQRCDVTRNPQTNEYLVVWGDEGSYDIYGQRLNATAGLMGANFPVRSGGVAWNPSAGCDRSSGEFLVVWEEEYAASAWDVYASRVSVLGSPAGSPFGVATAGEVQAGAALAYNTTDGQFLIVWEDFRAGSYDIYGQRWSLGGPIPATPTPTSTRIMTPTPSPTFRPYTPTAWVHLPIVLKR